MLNHVGIFFTIFTQENDCRLPVSLNQPGHSPLTTLTAVYWICVFFLYLSCTLVCLNMPGEFFETLKTAHLAC